MAFSFTGARKVQLARQARAERLAQLQAEADKELIRAKEARLALALQYSDRPKVMAEELTRLKAIGMPDSVAAYLLRSGEGKEILSVYDKLKASDKLNPEWIPSLIARVAETLGDEASPQAIAIATQAALNSGENMSTEDGQQNSLYEAIYAVNSIKGFANVDIRIANLSSKENISVPAVGGLTTGAKQTVGSELKNIQNQIISKIAPKFGQVFIRDRDTGDYTINYSKLKGTSAVEVQNIVDTAIQQVSNAITGAPGEQAMRLDQAIELYGNEAIMKAPEIINSSGGMPENPGEALETGTDIFGSVEKER